MKSLRNIGLNRLAGLKLAFSQSAGFFYNPAVDSLIFTPAPLLSPKLYLSLLGFEDVDQPGINLGLN